MDRPFLAAYSRELIAVCHRRGAHAMGGMSALIPIRNDAAANREALAKIVEDKKREADNGHDGTWVAHPDLIPVAAKVFDDIMPRPNQKEKQLEVAHTAAQLLESPAGDISMDGFDNNIQVALRYIAEWLNGSGAAPIFNMMEDAATAEIARAQLWQWLHYPTELADGRRINAPLFANRLQAAVNGIASEGERPRLSAAADLLESLATSPQLADFLTLAAYPSLD